MNPPPKELSQEAFSGGGEMGALVRALDWSKTPLGPSSTWPQSLRTTVSLCLSSTFPILIAWGPARVQIYNDAYRPICGDKHPASMGQPFNECWASALAAVGAIVDKAQAGEGSYLENLRMFLDRNGYLEEAFMTFSFSPIRDESGGVGGLFHPITETTEKMLGARRTEALATLTASLAMAKTVDEIGARLEAAADQLALDLPCALFYEADATGNEARLVASLGVPAGATGAPRTIALGAANESAFVGENAAERAAFASGEPAEIGVEGRFGDAVVGPYEEPPTRALLLPVRTPGPGARPALLLAGVSSRRALDATYRAFFHGLASAVGIALTTVRALAEEQARAEALAALDRAKTAFFSNVSHEFRTPLTLMIGPLEESLEDTVEPLSATQRARQSLIHRSSLRLLKLVNALLDFSRLEAGRVEASYVRADVATLTRDLVSTFRSTLERAGLALNVSCEDVGDDVFVDVDMWGKIVLNLVSNAFKHTFAGTIGVALARHDTFVELVVSDTGVGIPEGALPRIFERFHRVEGARGRSFEGSGIGLALVQELARLHGGTVTVESVVDRGSTFRVRVPVGDAHLPGARVLPTSAPSLLPTAVRVDAFVLDMEGWVDAQPSSAALGSADATSAPPSSSTALSSIPDAIAPASPKRPRLLVADDNADMRAYLARLLGARFEVETVVDGNAALAAVRARLPDLVLTDVMMPGLDGFGLLHALKADELTAPVPVVLLSARAGDEATLEGLQAGASDYVVKPFSARELVARVQGALQIARERARLSEVLEAMGDAFYVVDRAWCFRLVNASFERLTRTHRRDVLGRSVWDVWPAAADPTSRFWTELGRCMHEGVRVRFDERYEALDLWVTVDAYPMPDGITVFFRDVSEEHRASEARERERLFEQQLIGIVSHDLRNPLNTIAMGAHLLAQQTSDQPDLARVVQRLRNGADRATRLVRDLLDLTQTRFSGGIPVDRRAGELSAIVSAAVEEQRAVHADRFISLEIGSPAQGVWDADRLAQVVHNLLGNALVYSPKGSTVHVRTGADADGAILEIHNDGAPIPPDLLPRIFEPFQRGEGAPGAHARSIGLGLFIVDQIVRAHGGQVAVESAAGVGTTFRIRLPAGVVVVAEGAG